MNNAVLIGRLTKDPELRYIPNTGTAVCTFTLAVDKQVSRQKKDEMESKGQPTADFINIVVWGRQAENSANYLAKGLLTAVQGRIQTSTYEAKDGNTRFVVEVVANSVQFLEWADEKKQSKTEKPKAEKSSDDSFPDIDGFDPVDDENIPF